MDRNGGQLELLQCFALSESFEYVSELVGHVDCSEVQDGETGRPSQELYEDSLVDLVEVEARQAQLRQVAEVDESLAEVRQGDLWNELQI